MTEQHTQTGLIGYADYDGFPREQRTYNQDGLISMHSTEFALEAAFADAYQKAKSTGSWYGADIQWRAHRLAWAAKLALPLDGDFVECVTNCGGTSKKNMDVKFYRFQQAKAYS